MRSIFVTIQKWHYYVSCHSYYKTDILGRWWFQASEQEVCFQWGETSQAEGEARAKVPLHYFNPCLGLRDLWRDDCFSAGGVIFPPVWSRWPDLCKLAVEHITTRPSNLTRDLLNTHRPRQPDYFPPDKMYKYQTDNLIISLSRGDACVSVAEKCATKKIAFQ